MAWWWTPPGVQKHDKLRLDHTTNCLLAAIDVLTGFCGLGSRIDVSTIPATFHHAVLLRPRQMLVVIVMSNLLAVLRSA
jgi:hypothetical protein